MKQQQLHKELMKQQQQLHKELLDKVFPNQIGFDLTQCKTVPPGVLRTIKRLRLVTKFNKLRRFI